MNRILPSGRFLAVLGLAIVISFIVGCTLNATLPSQPPQANQAMPSTSVVNEVAQRSPNTTSLNCNVLERVQSSHSLIKNYPKQRQAFAPKDCARVCWQLFNRQLTQRMRLGFKTVENFTVTECGSSTSPRYGVNLACKVRFTVIQQEEWLAKLCAAH